MFRYAETLEVSHNVIAWCALDVMRLYPLNVDFLLNNTMQELSKLQKLTLDGEISKALECELTKKFVSFETFQFLAVIS
jgi:hypothetical protein